MTLISLEEITIGQDSDPSPNYMLCAFDCALFVCDVLSSGMDPKDLLREMSNIVVKFNDTRVADFMKGMNVVITLSRRTISEVDCLR